MLVGERSARYGPVVWRFKEAVEDMGEASGSLMALRPVASATARMPAATAIRRSRADRRRGRLVAPDLVVFERTGSPSP